MTDELLAEIENRLSLPGAYRASVRFMLACLSALEPTFSPRTRRAFEVATRFWAGQATHEDLDAARIDCWKAHDEINTTTSFADKDHCAIRAVLCVTYSSSPGDHLDEVLAWFVKVVRLAGCPESHIETSLLEVFGTWCGE